MSHTVSYDRAFNLCRYLTLAKNRFTSMDSLIIYPSAWYDGFFEITIRDKEHSLNREHDIDFRELFSLIVGFEKDEWFVEYLNGVRIDPLNEDNLEDNVVVSERVELPLQFTLMRG